jgi:hypothetical protein
MVDHATGAARRQNGGRGTARGNGAPVCPPAVWVKRTRPAWTSGGVVMSGRATPAKVGPRLRSRNLVAPSRPPPDSSACTSGSSPGGGWS